MRKYAKDKRPTVKPVIKAELSAENKKWRIVAVALLLLLGVTLVAFSAVKLLGRGKGYTEISAEDSLFSEFFTLHYDIGASGAAASAEHRRVREVYTEALNKYCRLFSSDTEYSGVFNIAYINAHAGEDIVVDSALYSALSKMETEGDAQHYLGITLEIYDAVFSSDGDGYASLQDPVKNEEMKSITLRACEAARDRGAVKLVLLGNNTVRLEVSAEYSAFASEYGLSRYIDLGIFENAFITDCIADTLVSEEMTLGAISSYDGYARNLDTRDKDYSFSFYAKHGDAVYPVCDIGYSGGIATYAARIYPTGEVDALDFYLYSDGVSAHRFIDSLSGEYKSALPEILLASSDKKCSDLALRVYSALVSDSLDTGAFSGVSAVWLDGKTVKYTGADISLSDPYRDEKIDFLIENAN